MSWVGAPNLELRVRCGGDHHLIRAVGSTLELVDHPDLDAELALIAFGGEEPPCVARHRLWAEALADGGFLAEWVDETRMNPTWFSWLAMALERMRAEGFHEFLRRLPPVRAQRMGEFLHHFPLPWIDRAAAAVSREIFDGETTDRGAAHVDNAANTANGSGVVCVDAPPLLAVATANRVRRAFVDAVGGRELAVGAAALVPLDIVTTDMSPDATGCLRGAERGVRILVGQTWLHRVWAVEAAVIDGRLVLALEPGSRDGALATVVSWLPVGVGGHRPRIDVVPVCYLDGCWLPE